MTDEWILDFTTSPTRVRIVKKTKKHVYVMNVLTHTTYKVHRSRLSIPHPDGETGRVFERLGGVL